MHHDRMRGYPQLPVGRFIVGVAAVVVRFFDGCATKLLVFPRIPSPSPGCLSFCIQIGQMSLWSWTRPRSVRLLPCTRARHCPLSPTFVSCVVAIRDLFEDVVVVVVVVESHVPCWTSRPSSRTAAAEKRPRPRPGESCSCVCQRPRGIL